MEDQAAGETIRESSYPIVGIGASAGGLEAALELLSALPASTEMAFVLVQHLDPARGSMLAEILGKKASIPVVEARDGMRCAPNHLYVIPPNAALTVSANALRVTPRERGGHAPGPIDTLFRSLAAERGPAAVGILLSGASSDGTRGAREIRDAGGCVLAQDPESAAFAVMPRSAIDAGAVDAVLQPAEIAHRLIRLGEHFSNKKGEEPGAVASDDEQLTRIFRLLRGAGGVDFTHYKRSTIERRIARRQALRHLPELGQYASLLAEDTAELNALAQDVLIGVTSFFRDPESFEALAQTVFPALLERRASRDPLRIWVPGCSTGEELYSIAICLMESLGERSGHVPIQLFGTDASDSAIARAREASYPEGIASELSPERLRRYFNKVDHHYRIGKPLRDLCVFARHDVTRDPPFSRIDLVSCRNLLIYLDAGLQRQVIAQFHYALNPQGFLLLGPSEAIGASADLFELTDKKRRVFRRRDIAGRAYTNLTRPPAPRTPWLPGPTPQPAALEADRVQREADRILLARYAPASIVVDEDLNVHQFRGQTGTYLEHHSGAASLKLQQLAPPALLIALKPALREARTARAAVRRELRLETNGHVRTVSIEVSPFRMEQDESGACYLVVFGERDRRQSLLDRLLEAATRRAPVAGGAAQELETLRRELAATREFLQSSIEEHEATKEELKSLHEEALSANEELQSTNEELETAKEELQSTNEELATTNDELRMRNQQLHDANDDLLGARDLAEAIVETVRHPLLVLDSRLRVQSANTAFYRLFRVEPIGTQGKLLYDLGNHQWDIPDLRRLLEETLSRSRAVEEYRVTHTFETLGERKMVLNARRLGAQKNESELILLGIEDATERLAASTELEDSDRRKDEFLAMLGHELRNPLAPVRNVLDIMHDIDIHDQKLRWAREVLERQIGQIVRLVDDLLEMSRISRGTLTLDAANMALEDAVTRAIEASRPLIEARKHQLDFEPPQQPVPVWGDLVRLTQLFTNLLTNAAKYTSAAGKIQITLAAIDNKALVTVSDNGEGIAAERLPRIFLPFMQSAGTSRTGLGIGLPLARRVAELHGGTIEAKSDGPGRGSVFTVKLPLLNEAPQIPGTAAALTRLPELVGCRVLVVDDNVDAANALQALLEASGCEVRCVYDGLDAVPLAEQFKPQVVLLDLALPDIDGYEVLRRLRSAKAIQPVIVALSGYAQPADLARMEQAGFDHSLRKPVHGRDLVMLIGSLQQNR